MNVTNDGEEFETYVKDNFILSDPSNIEDNNVKEEDDGYLSEGELSFEQTTEVNDEYFYTHVNDNEDFYDYDDDDDDDVHLHKRKSPPEVYYDDDDDDDDVDVHAHKRKSLP